MHAWKNSKNTKTEIITTIGTLLLIGTMLSFYMAACTLLVYESWVRTPEDQERLDRDWEARDTLTEEQKNELRSKYMLLMTDNIPDNEHGAFYEYYNQKTTNK